MHIFISTPAAERMAIPGTRKPVVSVSVRTGRAVSGARNPAVCMFDSYKAYWEEQGIRIDSEGRMTEIRSG